MFSKTLSETECTTRQVRNPCRSTEGNLRPVFRVFEEQRWVLRAGLCTQDMSQSSTRSH